MKRAAVIALGAFLLFPMTARAEMKPVHITGYCLKGTMRNGEKTHEGAVAYRKEDIGKTCRIYNADMELIGEYTICDTGGKKIRQGKTVDIWKPTKQECYALTQDGYIEIMEGESNDNAIRSETVDGSQEDGRDGCHDDGRVVSDPA